MREVTYKKKQSLERHRKLISINEHAEDKECHTYVRKSFVYRVTPSDHVDKTMTQPEVTIRKTFDSQRLIETFSFRVKGAFYMTDRSLTRVEFCHSLKINIIWKSSTISPNKSATLT